MLTAERKPFFDVSRARLSIHCRLGLAVNGRTLVDDARVVLARGQRYGLIGKNGCGKSALLQALASPGTRALHGLDPAALRCALVTQEHPSVPQACTLVSECLPTLLPRGFTRRRHGVVDPNCDGVCVCVCNMLCIGRHSSRQNPQVATFRCLDY